MLNAKDHLTNLLTKASTDTAFQEMLDKSVEDMRKTHGGKIANRLNQYYNGVLCKCKGTKCRLATGIHWSLGEHRGSLVARLCKEVKE